MKENYSSHGNFDHTKIRWALELFDAILINLETKFFFRSRLLLLFLDGIWWNIKEEIFNVFVGNAKVSPSEIPQKMSRLESRLSALANQAQGSSYVIRCKWWSRHLLECLCGSAYNILYSYTSKVYFVVHDSCRYLLSMAWFLS